MLKKLLLITALVLSPIAVMATTTSPKIKIPLEVLRSQCAPVGGFLANIKKMEEKIKVADRARIGMVGETPEGEIVLFMVFRDGSAAWLQTVNKGASICVVAQISGFDFTWKNIIWSTVGDDGFAI